MSAEGREYWNAPVAMTLAAQRWHSASAIALPYENQPLDLTLFVSCYNEEATIEATLDTIRDAMKVVGKSYEIIVIDDASKDRSVAHLRAYIGRHPDIAIVLRANTQNKGVVRNYLDAAFMGCGKYYQHIPGHNREPMETMADILSATGEADIIAPYYLPLLKREASPYFLTQLYNELINLISGQRINNYHARHVHLRFNVMRWHPNVRGYGFQAGLLCRLLDLGFTCKQMPCRREYPGRRLTFGHIVSVTHVMGVIALSRLSRWVYKE